MSLLDDITGTLAAPFTSAADGISRLWGAVKGIYHEAKDVFLHVGDGWQLIASGAEAMWTSVEQLGSAAYHSVSNVVTNVVPSAARWAWRGAEHAALSALHTVERTLAHAISTARSYVLKVVHGVEHTLGQLIHWLTSRVNRIVNWLDHEGTRMVNLVLHPANLVTWILPHLITPLLAFAARTSASIAKWLFRNAIALVHEMAPEIEDALRRLL